MRHPSRRPLPALSLAAALLLGPTAPLVAQPPEGEASGILERVTEWIAALPRVLLARGPSETDAYPILDPNDVTAEPQPGPEGAAQEAPPESEGETHPYLDPDG